MGNISKELLEQLGVKLAFIPVREYSLTFSIPVWKTFRDFGISNANFTDEEFENYNKETGYIGIKEGISCYVQRNFFEQEILYPNEVMIWGCV